MSHPWQVVGIATHRSRGQPRRRPGSVAFLTLEPGVQRVCGMPPARDACENHLPPQRSQLPAWCSTRCSRCGNWRGPVPPCKADYRHCSRPPGVRLVCLPSYFLVRLSWHNPAALSAKSSNIPLSRGWLVSPCLRRLEKSLAGEVLTANRANRILCWDQKRVQDLSPFFKLPGMAIVAAANRWHANTEKCGRLVDSFSNGLE